MQRRCEFFELSKTDSLSDLTHDVKIEVDIMVGREDGRSDFARGEQMPKIRACVALADSASAVCIERTLVFNVTRVLDQHAASARVDASVTRGPGR